jgi:hypothetical protein
VKKHHRKQLANRARKHNVFTGHAIYGAYSVTLPKRTKLVADHLSRLKTIFGNLFSDENFLTLLQAEAVTTIPAYLRPLLEGARSEHEIH